jgi:biopolymer transport protein TolR
MLPPPDGPLHDEGRHHAQEGFMGFSASDSARTQRSRLNVTPLVDVVLVLLIIFLIASPLSVSYLPVDVPQGATEPSGGAAAGLKVMMRSDDSIVIDHGVHGKTEVHRFELASTLRSRLEALHMDRIVFVEFEDEVAYGEAVSLMDTIKGVGADTVALARRR